MIPEINFFGCKFILEYLKTMSNFPVNLATPVGFSHWPDETMLLGGLVGTRQMGWRNIIADHSLFLSTTRVGDCLLRSQNDK